MEAVRLRQQNDSIRKELADQIEANKRLQVPCGTCLEYIMKMKGLEFKVADLTKERDHINESSSVL